MAETSDKVSSLAAKYATMTPDRLHGMAGTPQGRAVLAADIKSMAASLLRQDETKGLRSAFRRLIGR